MDTMLIDWSDKYSIGIPRIDEQHKMFFEGVHRLHKACMANEGEHVVLEAMVLLENYVRGHFPDEVAFMREHEYPRIEEHRETTLREIRPWSASLGNGYLCRTRSWTKGNLK